MQDDVSRTAPFASPFSSSSFSEGSALGFARGVAESTVTERDSPDSMPKLTSLNKERKSVPMDNAFHC